MREMGADILGRSRVPLFQLAAEVALDPPRALGRRAATRDGLAGQAIPLSGRIVAVVDFFDALTMDRCYRKAFADDVALAMLAGAARHRLRPARRRLLRGPGSRTWSRCASASTASRPPSKELAALE